MKEKFERKQNKAKNHHQQQQKATDTEIQLKYDGISIRCTGSYKAHWTQCKLLNTLCNEESHF